MGKGVGTFWTAGCDPFMNCDVSLKRLEIFCILFRSSLSGEGNGIAVSFQYKALKR